MLVTAEVIPLGKFLFAYSLVLTAALAFFLGREFSSKSESLQGMTLANPAIPSLPTPFQGRKPPSRGKAGKVKKNPRGTGTPTESELLPYESGGNGMAQGNGIIAVTASYGVGTAVVFVIDTNEKQMAIYEARGGSKGGRRLYLVGARRIDLDLKLEGYHDESEYSYQKLRAEFEKNGFFEGDKGDSAEPAGTESRK